MSIGHRKQSANEVNGDMRAINGDMPLYESPTATCSQKVSSKIPIQLLGPFFLRKVWLLRLFKTLDVYHTTNFKYQMRCLDARGSNIFCVSSFSRQYSYCCYSNKYTNTVSPPSKGYFFSLSNGRSITGRKRMVYQILLMDVCVLQMQDDLAHNAVPNTLIYTNINGGDNLTMQK